MATSAEILAAIAAATGLGIMPAQMVALIDRAMAAGLTEDGRVVLSTGTRGTNISFGTMADAIQARTYYHNLDIASQGIASAPGEFVCG